MVAARKTCWPFLFGLLLASTFNLPGAVSPPLTELTNSVQPTVTAAQGDKGGKYFGATPDPARTRHYYIAAEPQLWDYAPAGRDVICGKPLPPAVIANRNGSKIRYVQYTDDTFSTKVLEEPRLGLLGPVLRGTRGDFIAITFLNRATAPLSMHPHGLKYDKDSEGSFYQPRPGLGAAVGTGAKFTYVWYIDDAATPLPGEPSSKAWLYHSHVASDEEVDRGLVGFVIVTDPTRARADGTPKDVDREMAALFMIHDESGLAAAAKEAAEYGNKAGSAQFTWTQIQEQLERGNRFAINGFIFGNAPGLEINEGERVRWYLFALGSERDFHTAHWHGLRVLEEGRRRTDVVELLPASMKVADMVADDPGTWLFHCHVAEHMMNGMFARVVVHAKGSPSVPGRPFFGLPESKQSLSINRAQVLYRAALDGKQELELNLGGRVTVFEAFSVFTDPVQLRVGDKSVTFHLNSRGQASQTNASFQVTNADANGVVYGGVMEFQATLSGPDWQAELARQGITHEAATASLQAILVTLRLGKAQHQVTVSIQSEQ
jgi:hypothetical protein